MKKMICEMCEGTDLIKEEGVFVCQGCGTKYSVEEAKKLMKDVSDTEVKTVSTNENVQSKEENSDNKKLDNLYELARRAKKDNNSANAAKYYQMILLEDPSSWEANFYTVYYQAMQCTIGGIAQAAISVQNCLGDVIKLIHDNLDSNKQIIAVGEVALRIKIICGMLRDGAVNHFAGVGDMVKYKFQDECMNRIRCAYGILFTFGDVMAIHYADDPEMLTLGTTMWENAIKEAEEINGAGLTVFGKSFLDGYRKKVKDAKTASVNAYWEKHKEEKEQLEKEKEDLTKTVREQEKEIADCESKLSDIENVEFDSEKELKELTSKRIKLTKDIQNLGLFKKKEKMALEEHLEELKKTIDNKSQIANAEREKYNASNKEKVDGLNDKIKELKSEVKKSTKRIREIKKCIAEGGLKND